MCHARWRRKHCVRLVPCDRMEPWGTLAHHMGLNGGIRVVNTGNMEEKDMVFPGQAEPAIERGSFWCVCVCVGGK